MKNALVWFRRDLRNYDHAALAAALRTAQQVYCVFVFDSSILDPLANKRDRRLAFIYSSLVALDQALRQRGGMLIVEHGNPRTLIPKLAARLNAQAVFANRDYEPTAKARDTAVSKALSADGRSLCLYRDQVIFEGEQIRNQTGQAYRVFTPYKNAWLKRLSPQDWAPHITDDGCLAKPEQLGKIRGISECRLSDLGFSDCALFLPSGMSGAQALLADFKARLIHYHQDRNFPALNGVSYLSTHLRFGTLSIRELVGLAHQFETPGATAWLNELIWRDFYFMILDHFPHVAGQAFRPEYEAIIWDEWPEARSAWQLGKTGFPLVDAAMRQLLHTGYMHNRLRMLSASFLSKDLGLDWRVGESWFAQQLLDFDLAANNGGWQWAASTGCDAQPYFRIFNPYTQSQKFDPHGQFIRRYVPELAAVPEAWIHNPSAMPMAEQTRCGVIIGQHYPLPIVNHEQARQRTLARYAVVKRS